MARRLGKLPQVREMVPLSKEALFARVRAKRFPQPIQLAGRSIAWDLDEVEAWIEEQAKARDKRAAHKTRAVAAA